MRHIVFSFKSRTYKEQSFIRLLFFILLILTFEKSFAFDTSEDSLQQVASSREWMTLIYYTETNWALKVQSRADSPKFFVSAQGKTSALEELKESLIALKADTLPLKNESFSCKFPARANFINTRFNLGYSFDRTGCVGYQEWRKRVSADRASLVFSSYYLGNPSSSFGHILLRLGQKNSKSEAKRDLFDQGINFGASPWTENPVLYALLGLGGAFPGNFIAIPYYYKVREYNDYESRDLWEYDLNLSAEEVSKMIDLLWEQAVNHYDYYFLTENCGYYIIALIEATAPRYDLTSNLRKWVIPSETLATLEKANVLQKPVLRKSIRTQFYEKIEDLNSEDQDLVLELYKRMAYAAEVTKNSEYSFPEELEKKPDLEKAKIIDATIDYYDFKFSKKVLFNEEPYTKIKRSLLIRRADLPTYDLPPKTMYSEDSPDKSHGSGRFELGMAKSKNYSVDGHGYLLGYRFAFHDFLDHQQGAPQRAHIEIFKTQFQIEEEKIKFMYFAPFDIRSFPIWNRWDQNISWKVRPSFERSPYQVCPDCLVTNLNLAAGLTTDIWGLDVSILAEAQGLYSNEINDGNIKGLLGPGLMIKSIPFKSNWGWLLEGKYFPDDLNQTENLYAVNFNLRYHLQKNLNIDFGYTQEKDREIFKINFFLYHY